MRTIKLQKSSILVGIMMIGLVGCLSNTPDSTIEAPIPSSLASVTSTTSDQVLMTTIMPPLHIFHEPIAPRLLFVGDQECELPCWYGLEVGKSMHEEVAPVFKRILELPEEYSFLEDTLPNRQSNLGYIIGSWVVDDRMQNANEIGITLGSTYSLETQIVNTLSIQWRGFHMYPTTPQAIMEELGAPSKVWVDFSPTEIASLGILRVKFYYLDKHLSITTTSRLAITDDQDTSIAIWCLDGTGDYTELTTDIIIYSPGTNITDADNGLENLKPSTDLFGITPGDLFESSTHTNPACIQLRL